MTRSDTESPLPFKFEPLTRLRSDEAALSVTVIQFRRPRDARKARHMWDEIRREGLRTGLIHHSTVMTTDKRRVLTICSIADSESALVTVASRKSHVEAARWAIRNSTKVWSGVFVLRGTSSVSPRLSAQGTWADEAAKRRTAPTPVGRQINMWLGQFRDFQVASNEARRPLDNGE